MYLSQSIAAAIAEIPEIQIRPGVWEVQDLGWEGRLGSGGGPLPDLQRTMFSPGPHMAEGVRTPRALS